MNNTAFIMRHESDGTVTRYTRPLHHPDVRAALADPQSEVENKWGMSLAPCETCGMPTANLRTQQCDHCYELTALINDNPEVAKRILTAVETARN